MKQVVTGIILLLLSSFCVSCKHENSTPDITGIWEPKSTCVFFDGDLVGSHVITSEDTESEIVTYNYLDSNSKEHAYPISTSRFSWDNSISYEFYDNGYVAVYENLGPEEQIVADYKYELTGEKIYVFLEPWLKHVLAIENGFLLRDILTKSVYELTAESGEKFGDDEKLHEFSVMIKYERIN